MMLLFCACADGNQPGAQPDLRGQICPDRAAMFPAGLSVGGTRTRAARFELRTCNGLIQVLMFEADASKPAVFLDTHELWPTLLVHSQNVLVMQMIGGSSSPVYILRFRKGRALAPIVGDTQGMTRV